MSAKTRALTGTRKCTKFVICSTHRSWFNYVSRRRQAHTFCEGGPYSTPGCTSSDDRCRIWPGTDFYNPDVCTGEADWPANWAVNRARARQ